MIIFPLNKNLFFQQNVIIRQLTLRNVSDWPMECVVCSTTKLAPRHCRMFRCVHRSIQLSKGKHTFSIIVPRKWAISILSTDLKNLVKLFKRFNGTSILHIHHRLQQLSITKRMQMVRQYSGYDQYSHYALLLTILIFFQTCLGPYSNCADVSDRSMCPISGVKQRRKEVAPRSCSLATNCFACHRLSHCTWFQVDTKHICVSLTDEAILIEEHNRMQAEHLSLNPIGDDQSIVQQQSNGHFLTTTTSPQPLMINPPSIMQPVQDMFILPKHNQNRQNATCPLPCFMKSSCQSCIDSQCM